MAEDTRCLILRRRARLMAAALAAAGLAEGCREPAMPQAGASDEQRPVTVAVEPAQGAAQDAAPTGDDPAMPQLAGDGDSDGVADAEDACPALPGVAPYHGCPPPQVCLSVVMGSPQVREVILFRPHSDQIQATSKPILDEIVRALEQHPDLLVEVRGHSDGSEPRGLGGRRALTVRRYLVQAGIDPGRLTSHGVGGNMPVAPNDTDAGRARNRRVDFEVSTP